MTRRRLTIVRSNPNARRHREIPAVEARRILRQYAQLPMASRWLFQQLLDYLTGELSERSTATTGGGPDAA